MTTQEMIRALENVEPVYTDETTGLPLMDRDVINRLKELSSPWHEGAPTEEGLFIVVIKKYISTKKRVFLVKRDSRGYMWIKDRQGYFEDSDILAWVEAFKEENT